MPGPRLLVCVFVCSLVSAALFAQQPTSTTSSPGASASQAVALLQNSLAALTGGTPVTDVTMKGTLIVTFGSSTDSGTVTLIATSAGQGEITTAYPSGTRTEIRDISTGQPTLEVIGPDAAAHAVNTQSALSPNPSWFFPELLLRDALSSPAYSNSYAGEGVYNGSTLQQISLSLVSGASISTNVPAKLTQQSVYLDPESHLPVALTFNVHPYDGKHPTRAFTPYRSHTFNYPETVQFSDYQSIQGHLVPLHIRTIVKFRPGPLTSDIQISSVTFNTGATITAN